MKSGEVRESHAVVLLMSWTLCRGSVVSGQRKMQGANTMARALADILLVSSCKVILHAHTHVHARRRAHAHMHAHTHACTHTHTSTHRYTHTDIRDLCSN